MRPIRRFLQLVAWLRSMLGWQGLMIAFITLISFLFGLLMLIQEYQRPHETKREVLHSVLASWMRAPDYLGLNLLDYGARWRRAPSDDQRELVEGSLRRLGEDLEFHDDQFPLITIVGLSLVEGEKALASWSPRYVEHPPVSAETETIQVADGGVGPPLLLRVSYQVSSPVDSVFLATERYDDRLIEALIGLSGGSLLCFGYMVLYVQELRERVARESAQEATLDLADRTCHELGNVAFVVSNERRNLSNHIELLERFVAEEAEALAAAASRVGMEPALFSRFNRALRREYAHRRIAPDFELRQSVATADDICRRIAVCSDYITLTVRELDGYLKQSLTHESNVVKLEPVSPNVLFNEALALLSPRIEAADARVERSAELDPDIHVLADRRLMVHVLVNLVKNAIEAAGPAGIDPVIHLDCEVHEASVVLRVSDNGPGLPEPVQSKIFVDGFSTKGAGRGRGLAIVRESVQIQGGSIEALNLLDQGAEFRIVLPRATAQPEPIDDSPA